jgi:hypothetical protein
VTRLPEQRAIHRSLSQAKGSARSSGEVASPHRAGHYSGLHPEDQPYQTDDVHDPRRTSRRQEPIPIDEEYEYEIDEGYEEPPRRPSSVRRYAPVQPAYPQAVWRVQYHSTPIPLRASRTQTQEYPPPAPERPPEPEPRRRRPRARPRLHWMVYVGGALCLMLVGWQALTALGQWVQGKEDDMQYGYPRTYQTDAVVGHQDSEAHPSHFIVLNLRGHIFIYELPGGDGTRTRIYTGPVLYAPGSDQTPVTIQFQDTGGKGLPDLILVVGTERFMYHNTGTTFVPPKPNQ